MTIREQIIETVNKLFIYTDYKEWDKLQNEVFTEKVHMDMRSLGGEEKEMTAKEICDMWQSGLEGLDAVNHLGGNYLVTTKNDLIAEVFAYATATHYKAAATNGKTRTFVGSYELKVSNTDKGWRIYGFTYNLKYTDGNMDLT